MVALPEIGRKAWTHPSILRSGGTQATFVKERIVRDGRSNGDHLDGMNQDRDDRQGLDGFET